MPIESVMPSSHLILCRPLLLLSPILPSIRVFSNESTLRMRWPKYWSFSFSLLNYNSINTSNSQSIINFPQSPLGLILVWRVQGCFTEEMALRQSPGVENHRNVFMPLWAEEDMGKGGSIYPITCAKMHIHKRMNPFYSTSIFLCLVPGNWVLWWYATNKCLIELRTGDCSWALPARKQWKRWEM